jgi:hypothetical protein
MDPRTRVREREREFLARPNTQLECREAMILPADCTSSKKFESVYTWPRAPFYRETKGLLHTKNTLGLREYSQCERIQGCLFRLTYLQLVHTLNPDFLGQQL